MSLKSANFVVELAATMHASDEGVFCPFNGGFGGYRFAKWLLYQAVITFAATKLAAAFGQQQRGVCRRICAN